MTWPALVFGAAAGWQAGESAIDQFENSYDWAFYRDEDATVHDAIQNLDRGHKALAKINVELETDELFWADPFTPEGSKLMLKMLPAAAEMRLGAEQALESIYRKKDKVHANQATLGDIELGAWRWDTLGMKAQFTQEINNCYWDAFQNQTEPGRVYNDLSEITDINGRLEDLRDAITRLREMYRQAWLREYEPYWLDNVLIRYDVLAREFERKILEVRQAQREFDTTKVLTPPQQMGFYLQP
jgi:hexosaminidase